MTQLIQCSSCDGLRPAGIRRCPHCDAETGKPSRRGPGLVMALSLGAAFAVPLSACYGAPLCRSADGGFCQFEPDLDAGSGELQDGGEDAGLPDGSQPGDGGNDAGSPDGGPADASV